MRPRTEQLEVFYGKHAERLRALVSSRASVPAPHLIEDACQLAWLVLVRREDITLDERGFQWLITVATREAWRLAKSRDVPSGAFRGEYAAPGELVEPPCAEADVEGRALEVAEHDAKAAQLAALAPDERRALLLKAAGYRYAEIATLTDSTRAQVNHHLARGRRRLREARAASENPTSRL